MPITDEQKIQIAALVDQQILNVRQAYEQQIKNLTVDLLHARDENDKLRASMVHGKGFTSPTPRLNKEDFAGMRDERIKEASFDEIARLHCEMSGIDYNNPQEYAAYVDPKNHGPSFKQVLAKSEKT